MRADGLVLAGGKSRRMGGEHKGNLVFHEQTFQEHVIAELKKEADCVFLSYASCVHVDDGGCQILMDEVPGIGPVGGVYSGLKNSRQEMILVAACDMPLMDIAIYRYLYQKLEEEETMNEHVYDGVVPVTEGKMHPLTAIYRRTALKVLEGQIRVQNYRMTDAVKKMDIFYVDLTDEPRYIQMLRNINTLEDYEQLLKG